MTKRRAVIVKRIWVLICSRADKDTPIPAKHARVLRGLAAFPGPWGLKDQPVYPEAPDCGSEPVAMLSLKRYLGKGIVQPYLMYSFRYDYAEKERVDDVFSFSFNPNTLDYRQFVYDIAPAYIDAWGAYYAEIGDDLLVDVRWDHRDEFGDSGRGSVGLVWPVSFFDDELCWRAFELTPAEVADRVRPVAEHVRCVCNGVYIIGSSQLTPIEESVRLAKRLKAAILTKP